MRKESSISVYVSRKIILKDSWRDSGYYERYMLSKETLLPESVKMLGENPFLHSFMETVFEEMCRYYTLKHGIEGEYGCFLTSVGSWWGVENIADKDGNIRS